MKRSDDPKDKPLASEGRRNFFRRALLGAGALTVSCTTPLEAQKKTTPKPTTPAIDPKTIKPNWYPKGPGWNVSEQGKDDYLQLIVKPHNAPEVLVTNGTQKIDEYFTYNGNIPGPTVRMKGNETLKVHLINNLGPNDGYYACKLAARTVMGQKLVTNGKGQSIPDYAIYHHVVGPHQQNVTNLHTHGLHVSPGQNKGIAQNDTHTHSDNVLLRILPKGDYELRTDPSIRDDYAKEALGKKIFPLKDNEVIRDARYNFKIGTHRGPHYPGTQWYHPHPHGATFDQVASGMAGFLIIEGDVDAALYADLQNNVPKKLQKDKKLPERLFVIQRLSSPITGEDETPRAEKKKKNLANKPFVFDLINGKPATDTTGKSLSKLVAVVQPGQVEHWRFLNGSVDGNGYFFVSVTKGEKPAPNPSGTTYPKMWSNFPDSQKPVTKDNRVRIDSMAFDGVTLVQPNEAGDNAYYTTRAVEWLAMGPANRADFLFEAPQLEDGEEAVEYTLWAQYMHDAVDSHFLLARHPNEGNMKIATIIVRNDTGQTSLPPAPRNQEGELKLDHLRDLKLPEDLMPIGDAEIKMQEGEFTEWYNPKTGQRERYVAKKNDNKIRSRRVMYSGWGHAGVGGPKYVYDAKTPDAKYFNPSSASTTAIAGAITDKKIVTQCQGKPPKNLPIGNAANSSVYNAMLIDGKKFGANTSACEGWDTPQHKMALNTAEEWTMFNYSMTVTTKFNPKGGIFANTAANQKAGIVGQYKEGIKDKWDFGLPFFKGKARAQTLTNPGVHTVKCVHHPFHMHQNPFYVMSIKDQYGNELLPTDSKGKPIPRWQDTVWIPRNGGRVIMRSRFWDYTGEYVNHCHLLQHEDWGMMQAVSVIAPGVTGTPNFLPLENDNPFPYPALSLRQMFVLNMGMMQLLVDPKSDYYETTDPKDPKISVSMKDLFYDPNDNTFFSQDIVNIKTENGKKVIDQSGLNLPIPDSTSSTKQKDLPEYDENYDPNAYGPFPLWAGTGRESLYDLSKMPEQKP